MIDRETYVGDAYIWLAVMVPLVIVLTVIGYIRYRSASGATRRDFVPIFVPTGQTWPAQDRISLLACSAEAPDFSAFLQRGITR
jgi:hypothetical protein